MIPDYASCDWFHQFFYSPEGDSETVLDHSIDGGNTTNFLTDNQSQRFLERYFETYYILDSKHSNDLCLLRHSNGVCVIGLAPSHHLFHGCHPNGYDNDKTVQSTSHQILGLDFQVSDQVNRLRNHVQGRRKHGGHILQTPDDVIAYATCDRGIKHPIKCAIPGRLLEVNRNVSVQDSFESTKSKQIQVTPLGGSSSGSRGLYIWILLPNLGGKYYRSDKLKKQSRLTDSCSPELADTIDLELDEFSHSDPSNMSIKAQHSEFCTKLSDNFGLNIVTWNEYCKLRNITM